MNVKARRETVAFSLELSREEAMALRGILADFNNQKKFGGPGLLTTDLLPETSEAMVDLSHDLYEAIMTADIEAEQSEKER
jgi:hypothetical protein